MKNVLKKSKLLTICLLLTLAYSCSNDDSKDETNQDLVASIDENPYYEQSIGFVQTNTSGVLNYSISSQTPTGALFINETTGEVLVADSTLFDFETNSIITAVVIENESGDTANVTININDSNEIGEYKNGGIVFWIDPTDNTKGMVCALDDQSSGAPYGCQLSSAGATGVAIGTGKTNTIAIESTCTTPGTAADIVANLNLNGHSDWFLPSRDEFNEIIVNLSTINPILLSNNGTEITGLYHWTSTEESIYNAVYYNHPSQAFLSTSKPISTLKVRAIREFSEI